MTRVLLALAAAILLLTCDGKPLPPESIALQFTERLAEGDADGVVSLLCAEERAAAHEVGQEAVLGLGDGTSRRWIVSRIDTREQESEIELTSIPRHEWASTWRLVLALEERDWRIRLFESVKRPPGWHNGIALVRLTPSCPPMTDRRDLLLGPPEPAPWLEGQGARDVLAYFRHLAFLRRRALIHAE